MLTNKALKSFEEEVKKLEARLGTLENRGLGDAIVNVQKAVHELDLKLSNLKGKAALVGLVFGALTAFFNIIAIYNINEYRKFDAARTEVNDVLLETYQNKLADTIDRISLNEPSDEDKVRVAKLREMQKTFGDAGIGGEKYTRLSELTHALELIVIENKEEVAREELDKKYLPSDKDAFIAARALTLKAMTFVLPSRQCSWPEGTKPLVEDAVKLDSGVAAAFNIMGVCLTEEAKRSLEKPDEWEKGNKIMQNALLNYNLAYDIKPATGTKIKLLNNKVWADLLFLFAALGQKKLNEALPMTGYETMDRFFADSLRDLAVCQQLSSKQAVFLETEAELYGLKYAYLKHHDDNKNEEEASKAKDAMRERFARAINRNLYKKWKGNPNGAIADLRTDKLLQPLWYDSYILNLITERVSK